MCQAIDEFIRSLLMEDEEQPQQQQEENDDRSINADGRPVLYPYPALHSFSGPIGSQHFLESRSLYTCPSNSKGIFRSQPCFVSQSERLGSTAECGSTCM